MTTQILTNVVKMLDGRRKMEDVIFHRNLRLSSCIYAPTLLQALRNRYGLMYIAFHPSSYYDIVNLSNTRTPLASFSAIYDFDLKSALLIALVASALLAPILVPDLNSWLAKAATD